MSVVRIAIVSRRSFRSAFAVEVAVAPRPAFRVGKRRFGAVGRSSPFQPRIGVSGVAGEGDVGAVAGGDDVAGVASGDDVGGGRSVVAGDGVASCAERSRVGAVPSPGSATDEQARRIRSTRQ
ncbi:MAG TPA: hypothetical protein VEJ87_05050 [Acidimicrobiales bacterium]|nr:hypothetical protein [Acidimicrobiales bacterium]